MQVHKCHILMAVLMVLLLLVNGEKDVEFFLKLQQATIADETEHIDKSILWTHEYYFENTEFKVRVTRDEYNSITDGIEFRFSMGESLDFRVHSMIPRYLFQGGLLVIFILLARSSREEFDDETDNNDS